MDGAGEAGGPATLGPEVLEEACVVDSPTNGRGQQAEEEAEEGQDSVPSELGQGSAGKGAKAPARPLNHETSLGGWNSHSLGDMLANPEAAAASQEGGDGADWKEPATPEAVRVRQEGAPEGGPAGAAAAGPGGLGFTFSAPETASPPMLAAFGWSPTAQKARRGPRGAPHA